MRKQTVKGQEGKAACVNAAQMELLPKNSVRIFVLCVIVLTMVIIMGLLARYDYDWTMRLHKHRVEWLEEFMGRTLFEGEGYGGSDSGILFIAAVFFLYLYTIRKPRPVVLDRLRPYLGFGVSAGFVCSLFMVHSLKWVMGRARPGLVLMDKLAYSEWYEFGPHFVTQGIYRGSFPSGHTAAVLLFLSISYVLLAPPGPSVPRRIMGIIWGLFSVTYCVLMAIARAMALSHWLGDCMFSILMGWTIMHILYFWVLRVPDQILYHNQYGRHPEVPKLWELRLCWLILLPTLGGMALAIGIRSLWEQPLPWLAVLIPAGIFMILFFGRRLRLFHKKIFMMYQGPLE
jgi:membrane-associated phospholipid phosphatase